jgi:hypothetical protein
MERLLNLGMIAILFLIASCGPDRLKPDPAEPSLPRNYPSAEFYACGKHFVGLGRCSIHPGQDISEVALAVQGYHQGSVRAFSEALQMDFGYSYVGTSRYSIPLQGTIQEPVIVGVVVSPSYPGQTSDPIEVHPVMGFLLIDVERPGEDWSWQATKTPAGTDASIDLDAHGADQLFVTAPECGVKESIELAAESYRLQLSSLIDTARPGRCVFHMTLLGPEVVRYWTWMSWRYSDLYRPLALPALKTQDGSIEVTPEAGVAVIALDGIWSLRAPAKFKFDESKPHTLRLLTVKGRVLVGEYDPMERNWEWKK